MRICIGIICLFVASFSAQMFWEANDYSWFWFSMVCLAIIIGMLSIFPALLS